MSGSFPRTKKANAALTGVGATRPNHLGDTLLEKLQHGEIGSLVGARIWTTTCTAIFLKKHWRAAALPFGGILGWRRSSAIRRDSALVRSPLGFRYASAAHFVFSVLSVFLLILPV